VLARNTAIDAIFMLHADQVVALKLREFGSSFIGGHIFLVKLQADLTG